MEQSKGTVTKIVTELVKVLIVLTTLTLFYRILILDSKFINSSLCLGNSSFQTLAFQTKKCKEPLEPVLTDHQLLELQILKQQMDQVIKRHPKLKYQRDLPLKILIAARKHQISSRLLAAIIAQESKFQIGAYNAKSKDYGLGQINYIQAKRRGLSVDRLLTDPDYNLNWSAQILSEKQIRYSNIETLWYCRYNIGTRRLNTNWLTKCTVYANLVLEYYKI